MLVAASSPRGLPHRTAVSKMLREGVEKYAKQVCWLPADLSNKKARLSYQ